MKLNIFFYFLLLSSTIAQFNIKIAEGRTLVSYIIFLIVIISRLIFCLKINGFPIEWKISPAMELGAYGLTLIFFMSAKYKNSFPIDWVGFFIVLAIELILLIVYVVEEQTLVYTEREVTDTDET